MGMNRKKIPHPIHQASGDPQKIQSDSAMGSQAPLCDLFSSGMLEPFIIEWQREREERQRREQERPRLNLFAEYQKSSSENEG